MTTKVLDLNNIERKLFWALSSLLFGFVVLYLYSVLSLTVAGVERDQMTRAARVLASEVGDLEAEYMGLQNSITLARAEELGFQEVAPKFAGNADRGVKLSMAR